MSVAYNNLVFSVSFPWAGIWTEVKKTLPTEENIREWTLGERRETLNKLCDRLGIKKDRQETRDTVGWGMNARIEVVCLPVGK